VFSTGKTPSDSLLRRAVIKCAAAVVVVCTSAAGTAVHAKSPEQPGAVVALATLPVQAQDTHKLILAGGPFPYDKDGTAFGNRERQLPPQTRGYYREYTVKTPRAKNRGARRIVCGGKAPTQPDACFYTDDHYASFRRIVP
jgi:ribonuclease T1